MSRAPADTRCSAAPVRVAAGLLLAAVLMLLGAGPASAHGGGGPEVPAALSLPRVLTVEPPVAGLDVVVIDGGARLRLDNHTPQPVTATPQQVVSPGGSLAWADPRLGDPTAPPGGSSAWSVPLSVGGVAVTVSGDRVWPPAPHPVVWWALTVAALLGTYTVGGLAVERGRPGGATTALAGVVLVVTAAYTVHVVGSSLVLADPPGLAAMLSAAGIGVACWLLGPAAAVLTVRGQPLGAALYGCVGFLVALLALADTVAFHQPVVAFGGPFDLDRLTTVISFGGGLGLVLAAVAALRRSETGYDGSPPRPSPVLDSRGGVPTQ
jgi:hypothetical protein